MKLYLILATTVLALASFAMGQEPADPLKTRGRVVVTDNLQPANEQPAAKHGPSEEAPIVVKSAPAGPVTLAPSAAPAASTARAPKTSATRALSFGSIKSKIAEARRIMQSRPLATASAESTVPMEFVRIAFAHGKTGEIDFVVLPKSDFLSANTPRALVSQTGAPITAMTLRANGVNTPVTVRAADGSVSHVPLIVQYPVIKNGVYTETAYYASTHPGVVEPDVVNAGKLYVRNVIELARERLKSRGIKIEPKVADIAERLATVEHVDHLRFRTEPHQNIFNDIFTLYALNEGQTYRYSVSSAGAGGMVQMIPSTYRMVRSWTPQVPLKPDFVEGMRDHVNAGQAMLLYMQRTWNDLYASPTVRSAYESGIATQEQLMAAGYNSNPARLAGYINRGGADWTNLIPRETKIYLQIYDSIERNVPMAPRTH